MKRVSVLRKVLPLAVLVLISTNAFAKGKIFINSYLKTDYAVVTAQYDDLDNYRIKISNVAGDEFYTSSRIKGVASFQKLFDLSSLADGEYRIELKSRKETSIEKFSIVDQRLVVNEGNEKNDFLNAFFRVSDEKLYVSHMNFEKAPLRISIDDAYGSEIYNSALPKDSAYSGRFDIANLPTGVYQVSLKSGNKEYSYAFKK